MRGTWTRADIARWNRKSDSEEQLNNNGTMKNKDNGTGRLILGGAGIFAVAFCVGRFVRWNNKAVETTQYDFCSPKIPDSFDGFRIAQVSDVQSQWFGKDQQDIINSVRDIDPDIIVITGDLVDRNHTDFSCAIRTVERLLEIAPVYYINGNHELSLPKNSINSMYRRMKDMGVRMCRNRFWAVERGDERLMIAGVAQESVRRAYVMGRRFAKNKYPEEDAKKYARIEKRLKKELTGKNRKEIFKIVRDDVLAKRLKGVWKQGRGYPKDDIEDFVIMLTHCPQYIRAYAEVKPDLILTGHAHGGQFRLPNGQGVLAPGQGFFPEYTCGLYKMGDSTMLVSRGLGNSTFPLRLNNRPEVVALTLRRDDGQ